jgi:hypothetical protein
MNEWVYVLTVEALVFGLVSTTLVAQRIDVFTWPKDQTWPVFGTCVLVLLVYSLLLIIVCNIIKVSRLDTLTENISHGIARGASRLITVTTLWVIFQSVSVYTFEKRDWPLVLCQLWGTTCKNPGSVFWEFSYSVYLSILLPVLAWFSGLQLVVCRRMLSEKIIKKTLTRRCMNINILSILMIMSAYTIKTSFSVACKENKCPVGPEDFSIFDQQPGRKEFRSMQVLFVAIFFFCMDIVAAILGAFVYKDLSGTILALLIIINLLQMSTLPVIVKVFGVILDDTIMWVIFGLSCLLGCIDIGEICAMWVKKKSSDVSRTSVMNVGTGCENMLFAPVVSTDSKPTNTAFSIEKGSRKRLQLSIGGRGMWPYVSHHPSAIKKKSK